ncbi:MAG: thiolase family protein [Thermoanaerobacteraceae bacterium]|nr:thiolase family protein [Thermoanaerobacteraceae bacterium]
MENVVIVSAVRTPIGDFMGSLKPLSAVDLGVIAANAAIERAGINKEDIDEVFTGMVYKEGVRGNPARQIQLKCGIPEKGAAVTVDQQCASSMRAVELASMEIMTGRKATCLVVGTESMSNVPHLLMNARKGYKLGPVQIEDALLYDALNDAFFGYHMGVTAENLAQLYHISREEQDELAVLSHQRAVKAIKEGKFKQEIVPVEIKSKKDTRIFDTDEHPRKDTTMESLSKLKPVFKEGGTVTAGNASGINDGAAAVVMMAESRALELGIKPFARILSSTSYGVAPEVMGIGPAYGIPESIRQANLNLSDIDYFEINEAFAAQFLAVNRELKLDMERVNANGSGISLGHPAGCTGVRIIISLIYELKRREGKYGVAALCAGGGPSMSTVIENIK